MARPWVVLKYGGTSVATLDGWCSIARRVALLLPDHRVWLVVSALSRVTNALLRCLDEALSPGLGADARLASFRWVAGAHRALADDLALTADDYAPVTTQLDELQRLLEGIHLTQEVSPRLRARVAAYGELLSSQLGVAFLRARLGRPTARVDSRSLLTAADPADVRSGGGGGGGGGGPATVSEADQFLEADVRPSVQPERADAAAAGADVVICQGFIASTPAGSTCLLGRGGSDTSGALFASLVGAARLEIWTDVNGMFTADPRRVPHARLIRSLTYREAQELAAMGARVLHPRCLLPAAHAGVPVQVRNTMDAGDDAEITTISATGRDYLLAHAAVGGGGGGGAPSPSSSSPGGGPPPSPTASTSSRVLYNTAAAGASPSSADGRAGGGAFRLGLGGSGGAAATVDGGGGLSSPPPPPPPRAPSPALLLGGGGSSTPLSTSCPPSPRGGAGHAPPQPKVLAVARRKGVTLVNLSAFDMWGHSGFLSRVFAPFADHGVSVDLIATSQYAVSLTLDHIPDGVAGDTLRSVVAALGRVCATTVRHPCAVVSVVGRGLRHALPQLGAAMRCLAGVPVHMVSEASEDLNLSFVVDEEFADSLVQVRERRAAGGTRPALPRVRVPRRVQLGLCWVKLSAPPPPPPVSRRSYTASSWRAPPSMTTRSSAPCGRRCRAAAPPFPARRSTEACVSACCYMHACARAASFLKGQRRRRRLGLGSQLQARLSLRSFSSCSSSAAEKNSRSRSTRDRILESIVIS